MEVDANGDGRSEGIRKYYLTKLEELQVCARIVLLEYRVPK